MSIDVVDLRDFYAQRLGTVARHFVGRGIRRALERHAGLRAARHRLCHALSRAVPRRGRAVPRLHAGGAGRGEMADRAAGAVGAGRRARTAAAGRRGRSRAAGACAGNVAGRDGAAARDLAGDGLRRAVARRGAEPARPVGAHGHDAVRPRPALFALADHAPDARRLVYAGGTGARRCTCRRSSAAGFCARRWRGSASARPSRRRSPACISSRRPSRSIARSRPRAKSAVWCRRSSRCWRRRPAATARQS